MSRLTNSFRFAVLAATLFALLVTGCSKQHTECTDKEVMDSLVTADWLNEHLTDPDLVVLDCTVRMKPTADGMKSVSGRTDYAAGHIPSAGFADLTGALADTSSAFRFVLPSPEAFCAAMGALGVGNDSRVVLYDDFNSVWAARVWWMLRWVGFDRAAVLDGGLKAWTAGERPLSSEPVHHAAKTLAPAVRPGLIADKNDVLAAIDDDQVTLIDAMPEPHFKGAMVMYGRPGHIPGAVNLSSMSLCDDTGCFRPRTELEGMFTGDHNAPAITYCGAGVAASADAFVMTRLGFTDVAVYMGSLQEWAADPANPLVTEATEKP